MDRSEPSQTTASGFRTVTREELREILARPGEIDLIMASSTWGFRAKHLPRSQHFDRLESLFATIGKDRPVVVYCSNVDCHASHALAKTLIEHGYTNVRHYPGGLLDWEAAGLPIEGDWAGAGS